MGARFGYVPLSFDGGGDPYFANVKLLLGFEGSDGSTVITDESPLLRGSATVTGAAQIDTAQFKFGVSSLLVNGGEKITFPDSADWELSGPFTIECWIRISSLTVTSQVILGHGASSISYGWFLNYTNGGTLRFRFDLSGDGTPDHDITSGAPVMVVDTWYHVAVDRDGLNTLRLYIDGVMRASKVSATGTSFNAASGLDIGYLGSTNTLSAHGWTDELRITKGVARYASDAGFTVPSAAFPRS